MYATVWYYTCISFIALLQSIALGLPLCLKADLYAGAVFLTQAMDLSIYVSIIILLAIAALFSIAGWHLV